MGDILNGEEDHGQRHRGDIWFECDIHIGERRGERPGRNDGAIVCKALDNGSRNLDFNQ